MTPPTKNDGDVRAAKQLGLVTLGWLALIAAASLAMILMIP